MYEQNPAGQEETSATSGPDEEVRSGGVMEGLPQLPHQWHKPVPGSCGGLLILSAHPCLRTFQILKKCSEYTHFNYTI